MALSTRPKVLIVQPTAYEGNGGLFKTRTRWVMGLTLPYLAALTPPDVDVKVVDERLTAVDLEEHVDLVGMTVMTRSTPRAYDLARIYRDKGVPVVMGGFHVTLNPKDAEPHADALVMGEGEDTWAQAVHDAAAGRLKPVYMREDFHDMVGLPRPHYHQMPVRKYRVPFLPVQTSRGCPFACSYCEVSQVYGRKYRLRPIDEVLEEIKASRLKKVQFVDDNFGAKRSYVMALMEKLIPLKLQWTCLWPVKDSADEELVDLAKRSGCYHINMGLESIHPENLKQMRKGQNHILEYETALSLLNRKGMFYSLNFIFGWDQDTEAVFKGTLEFLERNRVPLAFFSILAPRPGTAVYDDLKSQGRIIREDAYEGRAARCTFQPIQMTPDKIESNIWWLYRNFYSPTSLIRRGIIGNGRVGRANILLSNLFFSVSSRMNISPLDFY